ncbi:Catechol 2,3-dioxygenase [Chryseobacterium soldanellicola]|uniref:Catechol 2,3-dioxygenase n=1 Tax=Chryseobacterium soldanellicola TaxID=311333 RepID=A0A1H0Y3B6_9FLAO|nr:VOC family protein [Chryseobacterium soldanellicola]SDQ09585.1 Catechol 2,3-dioxygenase [Chryseobacterium soldanellicola]
MNLVSIRIITADIEKLIQFYEQITGCSVVKYGPDFAELKMKNATLAIGSIKTLQFFDAENIALAAQNHSAIIEFMVDNVENVYERMTDFLQPYIVQKPTEMPWGNKSLLFRDPDGNLVNFFTPVTAEAISKFDA